MARVALILRYQWRAYWRRFIRTRHRAQYYLTVLAILGWWLVVALPPRLSRAAGELAAGQTASMEVVLEIFCVLWLFVVTEDASVSLTSRRLLAFPIDVSTLLGVRILSLFCSPVSLAIALGSVISLWPLISARHTVLGGVAALWLFALAFGLGICVSQLLSVAELRRKLLAPLAILGIALGAGLVDGPLQGVGRLRADATFTPARLATAAAVAATPSDAFIPLITLLVVTVPVCALLVWSFRRSVFSQTARRAAGRAIGSVLWFPGRFGGLVRKEQSYYRKLLDLWPGLLLVVTVSAASLFGSPTPVVRQAVMVIVMVLNLNVIMNCLGVDTAAELNRYFILPLRGRDVLLVKNLGLAVIVAAQLALLILTAAWRSGPGEAGAEIILAVVLLLSHLAWGNLVSVAAPSSMRFYRFAPSGDPLTGLAGATIGSFPAVLVLFLLHSGSSWAAPGIAAILLLAIAAYLVSLKYAGKTLEHRRHVIAERLSGTRI